MTRETHAPAGRTVRRQLEKVLASPDFDAPSRSKEFLLFIVEEALAGRGEAISQPAIATRVFGRKDDFDAMVDPIVRIQAGRLRRSLERYYLLSGKEDPIRIELPKGSYVPVFRAAAAAGTEAEPRNGATAGVSPESWPSVLLTGFEAAAPNTELKELAVQVDDELALELGRYWAVRVLRHGDGDSRHRSSADRARFALGGRLRQDTDGLRVSAHLVDRTTGEQVWGDEYHTDLNPGRQRGSPDDVARVVAARVGAEEGVVVQLLAAERRKSKVPVETPYDAVLLSYEFFLARDPRSLLRTVEALQRAVATQPECGPAWSRLARVYLANYAFEVTSIPTPIDEAIAFAQHGVRVDPSSRSARCILASALLVKGELTAARGELEQALRSSPDSLVYLEIIGYLLTLLGDWERGAALSRDARERNPHCLPHVLFGMWADGLRRGDVEQAYQVALEYRDATFYWRSVMRGACLGLLGRTSEARSDVVEILAQKRDFPTRGRSLIGYYVKFPEIMDRILEGLARGGLTLE
jgi:adenylate cyclase